MISVLQQGPTNTSPFILVGTITFSFPTPNWEHPLFALATRPTPSQSGNYDVFFNIGSRTNQTSDAGNFGMYHATANATGSITGFSNLALDPESIYMTTVSFDGTSAAFSTPVKVAAGLRNSAGIVFQPGTGDLYYADNGMDGSTANGHPSDRHGNAAYSLDTLHKISSADRRELSEHEIQHGFLRKYADDFPRTAARMRSPVSPVRSV